MSHNRKLENANVVAVFDSQGDADGAVQGLRSAGYRDDRIGYFTRTVSGYVTDILGPRYMFAGAVLGGVVGLALGVLVGQGMVASGLPFAPSPDPGGITAVCALLGAFAGGLVGGLIGWGIPRDEEVDGAASVPTGRFVVSVDAGDRRDAAWAIARHHGGHEARPPAAAATH